MVCSSKTVSFLQRLELFDFIARGKITQTDKKHSGARQWKFAFEWFSRVGLKEWYSTNNWMPKTRVQLAPPKTFTYSFACVK